MYLPEEPVEGFNNRVLLVCSQTGGVRQRRQRGDEGHTASDLSEEREHLLRDGPIVAEVPRNGAERPEENGLHTAREVHPEKQRNPCKLVQTGANTDERLQVESHTCPASVCFTEHGAAFA
jgi:hypothetical protein